MGIGRACRRVSQAPLTAGISRTNQVLFSTELVAFLGSGMAQQHPHAEATYRIIPLKDKGFGVEVAIPDTSPAMVRSFATEEAAQAWIAEHKRQAESGDKLPRRIRPTKAVAKS